MYRPKMFDFTLIAHAFYSYPFLELSRNKKFLYCLISNFCWTSDSFRIRLIDASYISMHLRYIYLIISKNRYDLSLHGICLIKCISLSYIICKHCFIIFTIFWWNCIYLILEESFFATIDGYFRLILTWNYST